MPLPLLLPLMTRRRNRSIVAILLIAINHSHGGLAFQSAPASVVGHSLCNFNHHGQQRIISTLMASTNDNEGYEDWYIDDGDEHNSDTTTPRSSKEQDISKPDLDANDNKDDIRTYFATCIPGLQDTLASELIGLGATHVETQGKSGVRFTGSSKVGFKSIIWCRTAHKIMELIASSTDPLPSMDDGSGFEEDYYYEDENDFSQGIRNREDLYQFTKSALHTPSLLGDGSGGLLTLSVSTIYASKAPKELCHGHFTALTVKNALVDAVRELREDGDRPDINVDDPDVPLVVVLRGRRVNGGRRGRRDWGGNRRGGGRKDNNDDWSYDEDNDEMVADVDIYRCLHSGGSLHRRGYRQGNLDSGWEEDDEDDWESNNAPQHASNTAPIHRAAMKESLAAGLLLEAGWDKLILAARGDGKGAVLVDPMTGSATLPTEAALIACDMAPGLLRIATWRGNERNNPHRYPPSVRWKDFGSIELWNELLAKATQRAKSGTNWARSSSDFVESNVKILCNEMNPRAANLAQMSIRNAGVKAIVSLNEGDCIDWDLGGSDPTNNDCDVLEGRTIFACNPPWGLRLTDDIDESWVNLREFLRREAGGCEAWVLSGNKDLTKILRMKKSRNTVIKTGDEDLRWLQYHIFQKKEIPA